jgi:AAHS family 4-hydroxybenzoate transporter-like MFS transporter
MSIPTSASPSLDDLTAVTTRLSVATAVLCFLVILLDGYDTAVVAFAAPSLAHDWGLAAAAFTPAFVATSLGAVIGYVSCGALTARFGHRRVIVASVVTFALLTFATILVRSIPALTVLRLATALGLGGAIPTAIALASDHAPPRWREMTAAVVTVAIIFGGTLGGMAAVPLLHHFGWPALFVVGALLPLALAPALGTWLPDRPRPPVPSGSTGGSVAVLFQAGLALPTALLWAMAFLTFMQSYTFTYWLPLLLTSFGFGRATAALGNTYIGSGAIAGVVLMVLLVRFVGSARYLAIAFAVGTCFVLLLALGGLPAGWIPALLFLIGAGLGIGGVGQAAIGAMLYPTSLRTTGIGWSSAAGRLGSILGPAIAGAFLGLHWQARSVIAAAAVPALLSAAAAAAIFVVSQRRPDRSIPHG